MVVGTGAPVLMAATGTVRALVPAVATGTVGALVSAVAIGTVGALVPAVITEAVGVLPVGPAPGAVEGTTAGAGAVEPTGLALALAAALVGVNCPAS